MFSKVTWLGKLSRKRTVNNTKAIIESTVGVTREKTMAITNTVAYQQLIQHPKTFLKKYCVNIAGANVNGATNYYIQRDTGGVSKRPGRVFKTKWMSGTAIFNIKPWYVGVVGCHQFNAYNIAMVQSNNNNNYALYQVPLLVPNILVTGLLSGCSFVVGGPPNAIQCVHVHAVAPMTSTALYNNLINAYPNHSVYGRGNYNHMTGGFYDRTVSIVGIRRNNSWKLYAQKHDSMHQQAMLSVHIEYKDAWYHAMNRGRNWEVIFHDKYDYRIFIELLKETSEMWNFHISAYCLMPNHYHLLIQTPDANLSRGMRHINGLYLYTTI